MKSAAYKNPAQVESHRRVRVQSGLGPVAPRETGKGHLASVARVTWPSGTHMH